MRHTLFIILSFLCLNAYSQIPVPIQGNWINNKTDEWEYGFFDQFAIYESDFWEYASLNAKKNKVNLTLQKEDQSIKLEISIKNDSVLQIKNGKLKEDFNLMKKKYPQYKVKDHTSFSEPVLKKDSATIIGYYHNFYAVPQEQRGENTFLVSVPDFVSDKSIECITTIDSLGRFSLTFPLRGTQQYFADWRENRLLYQLVSSPGDTLVLFADMHDLIYSGHGDFWNEFKQQDKQILFMGDNARVNNELMQYKAPVTRFYRNEEVKKNGLKGMDLLNKGKAIYEERTGHLNKYIQSHPTISDKFIFFCTETEKYDFASQLMQHRFDLDRNEGERFEEGYIEFAKTSFPLNDPRVYTFSQDFKSFLTDYIGYLDDTRIEENSFTVTLEMVRDEMDRKNLLDQETRENLNKMSEIRRLFEAETDSLKQIELLKQVEPLSLALNSDSLVTSTIQEMFTNYFFQRPFKVSDSILSLHPTLKELWDASLFYDTFDHDRLPLTENQMTQLNARIKTSSIRAELLHINNYYSELANKTFTNEESFKNTDHLNDITDMDELFRKLLEPYRGNVIYLDFWGTWCSPCRENMKLAGTIEEELHDKDVIFMYLANRSPEESWKNIVKEMNLTGDNIVHYRLPDRLQDMLEKHLSVYEFPTYMLIDKGGDPVNKKAPSPRQKELLIQDINRLLEE